VEFIHDELVAIHMPFDEPIDPKDHADVALLESAVNRSFQTFDTQELYETLPEKAAALFHSLVCNHCFKNGNKRTALMALDMFMTVNDHCFLMSNGEAYEMAKRTATANLNRVHADDTLADIAVNVRTFSVSIEDLEPEKFVGVSADTLRLLKNRTMNDARGIMQHPRNRAAPSATHI
jgi:death-on-curing family protein